MPGFNVATFGKESQPWVSGRREYYRTYTWRIDQLFGNTNFLKNDSPLISLKDAELPTFIVNKELYQGASLEYKFAKSVTWTDIKVSWYDTDGLLDVMTEWRRSVWTPECGLQPASVYKKNSKLTYYMPDGSGSKSWLLVNSWPSSISEGQVTYTTSDIKMVQATVTYDWAKVGNTDANESSFV